MRQLLKNSVKCLHCNTEIISKYRHNYASCKCENFDKKVFTDGGMDYQIISFGGGASYLTTSVYDDGLQKTRREYLMWGVNYYKDGRKRQKTKWTKIKDLETEHIWNILNINNINKLYLQTFIDEIIYRENEYYTRNGITAINEIS